MARRKEVRASRSLMLAQSRATQIRRHIIRCAYFNTSKRSPRKGKSREDPTAKNFLLFRMCVPEMFSKYIPRLRRRRWMRRMARRRETSTMRRTEDEQQGLGLKNRLTDVLLRKVNPGFRGSKKRFDGASIGRALPFQLSRSNTMAMDVDDDASCDEYFSSVPSEVILEVWEENENNEKFNTTASGIQPSCDGKEEQEGVDDGYMMVAHEEDEEYPELRL